MVKNLKLLDKALQLLPEVKETVVEPLDIAAFLKPLKKGDSVEIDFGRHLVGHIKLKLGYVRSHPDAPVWLRFSFAENKKEFEERVEDYQGWICSAWVQQEQVHIDLVPGEYFLPRRYSFRYVKIEVLDVSSKFDLIIEEAKAVALSSADDSRLSAYHSENKELEQLDRIACNTLHDCMQKVFEDGPKRDQRLWMGDLRLQALANYETYQMNDMVKGCLYLFGALPMENGQVGACVFLDPEPEVDDTSMFDYSLLYVVALWDYYKQTKDKEALRDLWETARTQISLAQKRVDNGIVRDARVLGTPKMLLLGLQHMFAMFGATILVPILVNSYFQSTSQVLSVQVTLFCAGFGTLFFHLCTKFKVPAFLGSSFAFLGGFSSVAALDTGIFANMADKEKLQYACGGIVVAGLLYLILALIIRCVGVKRVMRFLPPVVTGPIIICIGLSLAPSAVSNASTNWLIAIVALAVIIIFNIWGKGMFKIIPILLGVVISYVFALVLQGLGFTNPDGSVILNFSGVSSAAVVGLPPFILPKFNLTAILIMAPIAIATMMEHIGDISAISATVGQNFIEDPGLHRTLIGDGIATSISAMIGGPANTTYGENTGVLELSRVHDPKVVRLAACYAIVLSFIPKVAEIIASMPASIIGGVSFILYGMISAIGVRNVVENHVDFTKSRNLIIAGVILVSGLGFSDGLTFTIGSTSITLTSLAIAAIAGIVLNAILPGNDYAFGKDPEGDASRGVDLRPHELEQELKNQK